MTERASTLGAGPPVGALAQRPRAGAQGVPAGERPAVVEGRAREVESQEPRGKGRSGRGLRPEGSRRRRGANDQRQADRQECAPDLYEAEARAIQDFYLAGDSKSAIAAVPAKLVEAVALVGPWAKIADEIQRWKQTVLTTFSVNCDPRYLEKIADLIRG